MNKVYYNSADFIRSMLYKYFLDAANKDEYKEINKDFENNPKGAIEYLLKHKKGECVNVYYRKGIGWIDIVWGSESHGLCHIDTKHPEVVKYLPDLLKHGELLKIPEGKYKDNIYLVFHTEFKQVVTVALTKRDNGKVRKKNWILTFYIDYYKGLFSILADKYSKRKK